RIDVEELGLDDPTAPHDQELAGQLRAEMRDLPDVVRELPESRVVEIAAQDGRAVEDDGEEFDEIVSHATSELRDVLEAPRADELAFERMAAFLRALAFDGRHEHLADEAEQGDVLVRPLLLDVHGVESQETEHRCLIVGGYRHHGTDGVLFEESPLRRRLWGQHGQGRNVNDVVREDTLDPPWKGADLQILQLVDLGLDAGSAPLVRVAPGLSIARQKEEIRAVDLAERPDLGERVVDAGVDLVRAEVHEMRRELRDERLEAQSSRQDRKSVA